jgi:hypothetical protein
MSVNFGVMKTRTVLNINNLASSNPHYAYRGDFVNEAANRVIIHAVSQDRRNVNNFPELRDSWWETASTNNSNSFALPDDLLVLESARCTRLTTSYDPAIQQTFSMTEYPDPPTFTDLAKTAKGWPTLWRRAANRFEYWPTTSTTPTDYSTVIVIFGIAKEQALTSDSQTFVLNELWHPTIIKCATALMMDAMGLPDAGAWWDQVDRDVTATINLVGLENIKNNAVIEIAGVPR